MNELVNIKHHITPSLIKLNVKKLFDTVMLNHDGYSSH